jgi:hypothetical protein
MIVQGHLIVAVLHTHICITVISIVDWHMQCWGRNKYTIEHKFTFCFLLFFFFFAFEAKPEGFSGGLDSGGASLFNKEQVSGKSEYILSV